MQPGARYRPKSPEHNQSGWPDGRVMEESPWTGAGLALLVPAYVPSTRFGALT